MADSAASVEGLVETHAELISNSLPRIVGDATTEEDLRIAFSGLLDSFISASGLAIPARHEFGLAGGRIDSKYGGVIIEYKSPSGGSALSAVPEARANQKLFEQLSDRFEAAKEHPNLKGQRLFGIGTDGRYVLIVRDRGDDLERSPPLQPSPSVIARLLRAIVSLGARGRSFESYQLARDFGAESRAAQQGISSIYRVLEDTSHPRVKALFGQWETYFREVTGYDPKRNKKHLTKLSELYGLPKPISPSRALFALHTYYAVFTKLLASEIVASFNPIGTSTIRRCVNATDAGQLRRELANLEQGGIWNQLGIKNFLEGDIFAWYLDAWDASLAQVVRAMLTELDAYDPATLSVDPEDSRDLLKELYQSLLPETVRHGLGEYYTPDWLAEYTIGETQWDGDPRQRVLDPACGSGTFLIEAIRRARAWWRSSETGSAMSKADLLKLILNNIVGFDLNPLAVLAARTNYLLAIRDLLKYAPAIELPVYLSDSILTPSEYGDLFTSGHGGHKRLPTTVGDFLVPGSVAESRDRLAKYIDALEADLQRDVSPDEFLERLENEGWPVAEEGKIHRSLYAQLRVLRQEGRDGVWARIIKNAFAPLLVERVDFVVGNPPWVNWEHLPAAYRKETAPLWKKYGIFEHEGYDAKLGGAKDDISILMTYVAVDRYLKTGGQLGFVITQTVFKTKGGGAGFRTFQYRDGGKSRFLVPERVDDMTDFQPFENVNNRTAVVVLRKSADAFAYPVPYRVWEKKWGAKIPATTPLSLVRERTMVESMEAHPVDEHDAASPWLTGPDEIMPVLRALSGRAPYTARKGVTCPTNAVYWLTSVADVDGGRVMIENLADTGKTQVEKVTRVVEADLVDPLVRGRDVSRWQWDDSHHIVLPQNPEVPKKALSVNALRRQYPLAYDYFHLFEDTLRGSAIYRHFFASSDAPFYSCYNIGDYTFAPYKVVWKEIAAEIEAAVVSGRRVVPDHKLVMVAFSEPAPAYFLSAILNSIPLAAFVRAYAIQTSISGHVFDFVGVPTFNAENPVHAELSELSRGAHDAAREGQESRIEDLEARVDALAAELLGLNPAGLDDLRGAVDVLRMSRREKEKYHGTNA